MRVALDTNVLAYAAGLDDFHRKTLSRRAIASVPAGNFVVPVHVLGELFNVLRRKMALSAAAAQERADAWRDIAPCQDTTISAMAAAMSVVAVHKFSIWDAVILSAAAEAGCRVLLSEDLQDGFTWGGVTVVNPSAEPPHPLLADLTAPPS